MIIKFKLNNFLLSEEYKALQEQSMPRKDAINYLTDSEEQRIENLLQIFILNNEINNHWCNELYSVCHQNPRLAIKKKYFNKEELFDILFGGYLNHLTKSSFDQYLFDIADKEDLDELPEFEFYSLYNFMYDYHEWLAVMLTKNLKVSNKEVKEEIQLLLGRYK